MWMNTVIIGGNLVADPEYRVVGESGVVKFRLISDRKYTTKAGDKKTEATGIDFEAWGKTAELINQYVIKGQYVLVKGRLKEDRWEKDGQKRSRIMVSVSDGAEGIQFGQKPKDKDGESNSAPQNNEPVAPPKEDEGKDVPF